MVGLVQTAHTVARDGGNAARGLITGSSLSFTLSLSKGRPFMVRQAHHERATSSEPAPNSIPERKRKDPRPHQGLVASISHLVKLLTTMGPSSVKSLKPMLSSLVG